MGDPGESFINVGSLTPDITGYTNALRSAIDHLPMVSGSPYGTLYFGRNGASAGEFRLAPRDVGTPETLVVPAGVSIRVAPNTSLHLEGSTTSMFTLAIAGSLFAPPTRIFRLSSFFLTPTAAVEFVGPQTRRVFPEWWGAGNLSVPDALRSVIDAFAIQAALTAAWTARVNHDPPLTPLQVHFLASYLLGFGLTIPPARTPLGQRRLSLRSEGRTGPTLSATSRMTGGVMLDVASVDELTLEGMVFDGGGIADQCLRLTAPHAPMRRVLVRQCEFRGARTRLVHVGKDETDMTADIQDLSGISFLQCSFVPTATDVDARGVVIRSGQTRGLRFSACTFEGTACAMIYASGASLQLSACQFRNHRYPTVAPAPGQLPSATDIFLDALPGGLAASVNATLCVTSSVQFLSTMSRAPTASEGRDSVLCAVRSAMSQSVGDVTFAQAAILPPTIDWNGAGALGATLTLLGCAFDAPTEVLPHGQRVNIGPLAARVVDITSSFADGTLNGIFGHCRPPALIQISPDMWLCSQARPFRPETSIPWEVLFGQPHRPQPRFEFSLAAALSYDVNPPWLGVSHDDPLTQLEANFGRGFERGP